MRRSLRRRRPAGFTFMELIACLAIIALTTGLLFPVFARTREAARRASCQSNLQQLGQALHLYAQDYNGLFPPAEHDWTVVSQEYVQNTAVFACPSEPSDSREAFQAGRPAGPAKAQRLFSSYVYRAGLANDDRAASPIARDWERWHHGGANVLYLGGYVAWERQLLPETRAPRPKPPAAAPGNTSAPSGQSEKEE